MTEFHINKKGNAEQCHATKVDCPFGGESGKEDHYGTKKEARAAAEEKLEEEYGEFKISKNKMRKKKQQDYANQAITSSVPEVNENGTVQWLKDGRLNRTDGPAQIVPGSHSAWYDNGWLHREDGPAIEWADGGEQWYKGGALHREDGPALTTSEGFKEYWYDGARVSEEGLKDKVELTRIKTRNVKIEKELRSDIGALDEILNSNMVSEELKHDISIIKNDIQNGRK